MRATVCKFECVGLVVLSSTGECGHQANRSALVIHILINKTAGAVLFAKRRLVYRLMLTE